VIIEPFAQRRQEDRRSTAVAVLFWGLTVQQRDGHTKLSCCGPFSTSARTWSVPCSMLAVQSPRASSQSDRMRGFYLWA
jgi:hypothetical protein